MSRDQRSIWRDSPWRAVVAAFALNGLLFGVWASRIPAFKLNFELSPGALGFLLLALAAGAIVSFPLAGALSERWGPESLTIRCAAGYVAALILLGLAPSIGFLGIALFIFGGFHGAMDVAMNGWGARVETRLRRPTMSIFHAVFSLGAGLGAASGFVAINAGLGPMEHFALIAIGGGGVAMFCMIAGKNTMPFEGPSGDHPIMTWPSKTLVFIGLIAFSVSMGEGAMADWSAVYLRLIVEASEAQAALGYAAFSTMMVLTRLSGALVIRWLGPVSTTRISGILALIGLAVVIRADALPLSILGFSLLGVGYAIVMPLVFSRAAQDPIIRPGPAIASVATLGYGGMLLGPPVVGFIAQVANLKMSFAALAGLAVLSILLAPNLRPVKPTPSSK